MNGDEIWVVAPKGFRPSQWVEMLIDFDEAYDLDPHLVDRRLHEGAEILILHTQLLDPAHPEAIKHNTLLWDMLDKVARMGLVVRAPQDLAQRFPELWDQVMAFCTQRKVKVE